MKRSLIITTVVALFVFAVGFTASSVQTPPDKITICHIPPGNPDNAHPITISVRALNAHLAHGDVIGDCSDDCDDPECDDE